MREIVYYTVWVILTMCRLLLQRHSAAVLYQTLLSVYSTARLQVATYANTQAEPLNPA